jgi:glutaconate CoA-transferase subunit B
LLIAVTARLLDGCRHVIVGASSPIPGSAALLMRELTEGALRVTVLGSTRNNSYTDGGVETFDLAAQGRVDDVFFWGAARSTAKPTSIWSGPAPIRGARCAGRARSGLLTCTFWFRA